MKVIAVPLRLRVASSLLFLSIPLAALQVVLVSGAPIWNLPQERMSMVSLLALVLFIPLVHWLNSGKTWALALTGLTATSWILISLASAFHLRSFWVAVFVICLTGYWALLWAWLKVELEKSYFDPRMKWYHGNPEAIPGLKAHVLEKEGDERELRVCRFDREGAFVFQGSRVEAAEKVSSHSAGKVAVRFLFRGRAVQVLGTVVRELEDGRGFGVRFDADSPDLRKELGDFMERLRGEGYA